MKQKEDIIKALNSEVPEIVIEAADSLKEWGNTSIIPILQEVLRKDNYNEDVIDSITRALSRIGFYARPVLLEACKDKNYIVRMVAAIALRNILSVPNDITSSFIKILKDEQESGDARGFAAKTLGKIRASDAKLVLIEALKDKDHFVIGCAAEALADIGAKDAVPALIELLKDKENFRRMVVYALGEIGDPSAIPALIEALKDEEEWVRSSAAEALGKMRDKSVIPVLIEALKNEDDSDEEVISEAAKALGKIGPEAKDAVPALINVLNYEYGNVKQYAAEALGNIGSEVKGTIPALIKVLKNEYEDSDVRKSAARALGKIGPTAKDAVPVLVEALKNEYENKDIRDCKDYIIALGYIGPAAKDAVPMLIEALKHKPEYEDVGDVRSDAAFALGKIGSAAKDAVPELVELLQDEERTNKMYAAEALGKIGPEAKDAVPALINALNHKDVSVEISISTAIYNIGPAAIPFLIKALKDWKDSTRLVVAEVLGNIGDKSVLKHLNYTIKNDSDECVRIVAKEAAKKINNKSKRVRSSLKMSKLK